MGGLLTTVYTIREASEERQVSNLFALTRGHREIWSLVIEKPELSRVLNPTADIDKVPVTEQERLFVLFLILHLATSFEAKKRGMFFVVYGLQRDVREFFNLPIPRAVWTKIRRYQQPDFVQFVDKTMNDSDGAAGD